MEVATGVQTDENGQLQVPISTNGNYQITANKADYLKVEDAKTIECTMENNCNCDTSLTLNMDQPRCDPTGPTPIILPVTVKDNITNSLIPGALVTLVLRSSLSGPSLITVEEPKYTDSQGAADFTIQLNGEYSLSIDAQGYVLKEEALNINCNPNHCESCTLRAPVSLNEDFCENKSMKMIVKDSLTNEIASGANLIVSINSHAGPREILNEVVGESGFVEVPITSNGIYTSEISKPGYITMTSVFQVSVSLDECEIFSPVQLTPLPPRPPKKCVRMSLTWGETPEDLDLYSHRVSRNETTEQCLTYYCDGKDPCNGTVFDIDNKNGGLNGSETITYCNTEDFSNMVFVDDLSGEGSSLLSSRARLIITGSNRVEEIQLNTDEAIDAENKR